MPAPLLLVLLAIAGCAATGPAMRPAAPLPPLARAALAEWEGWGGIVLVGWPEARPADTAATPPRFARLLDYWGAVPGMAGVALRLAEQRRAFTALQQEEGSAEPEAPEPAAAPGPEDIGLYAYPAWSAAFISAVARRAGLPESDFPPAATHARYIDAMLARATADPDGAAFLPFAPEDRSPAPGDLLCADRALEALPHWSARLAEAGRFRPMHCDVVVRAGPGLVEAIGGNVQDLVVLRRLPADAEGRVLPAPPGKPRFFLVLAARERR
jgi:hypothetical protein